MMRHVALLALFVAAAGCAPSLNVRGLEEPTINTGSRELVITDALGTRAGVGLVVDTAFTLIAEDGWFFPEDGTHAMLGDEPLLPDTAYLSMDVLAADSALVVEESASVDENGESVLLVSETTSVRVAIAATIVTDDGELIEIDTEGVAEKEGPASELELLDLAAREAVRRVLDEITPDRTSQSVPLDDRDEQQKRVVALAMERDVDAALALETKIVNESPTPAAHYNRAVMLDYLEDHEGALDEYKLAREGADAKLLEMIDVAAAGCEARLAAQRALE